MIDGEGQRIAESSGSRDSQGEQAGPSILGERDIESQSSCVGAIDNLGQVPLERGQQLGIGSEVLAGEHQSGGLSDLESSERNGFELWCCWQFGDRLSVVVEAVLGVWAGDFNKQSSRLAGRERSIEELELVKDSAEVFDGGSAGAQAQWSGVLEGGRLQVEQPDVVAVDQVAIGLSGSSCRFPVDEQSNPEVVGVGVLVGSGGISDLQRGDQVDPTTGSQHIGDAVANQSESTPVVDIELQQFALGVEVESIIGMPGLVVRAFGEESVRGGVGGSVEVDQQHGDRHGVAA